MILLNMKMEEALRELEDNCVDSIVTDPPYGIDFMSKKWDYDVPSVEMWQECLRVLKPGGHLLSFSSARTYHRMAVYIEDAGFDIRDQVMWVYGSGFPKSRNIGKAYDKKLGRDRTITGSKVSPDMRGTKTTSIGGLVDRGTLVTEDSIGDGPFEGWGTALKPSHEPICVARKPLSEKTVLANMMKWGTGAINIDASRVEDEGRWPANFMHDGSQAVLDLFPEVNKGSAGRFFYVPKVGKKERNEGLDGVAPTLVGTDIKYREKRLEEHGQVSSQSVNFWEDAAAEQRAQGKLLNTHPTVKPIALMEYLIKMVTPCCGTTLDPFMGSGSTGCAAVSNGFDFIGIEMEKDSFDIAEARIEHWSEK